MVSPPRDRRGPGAPARGPDLPVHPCSCPLFAGACRVLVGPVDRGVDRDGPFHPAYRIVVDLDVFQQVRPGLVRLPAGEPLVDGLPRPAPLRQITPGGSGPQPPQHPVDHLPVITPRTATPVHLRQQGLYSLPRPSVNSPLPVTRSIIGRSLAGIGREARHEEAQSEGGRPYQAPTEHVRPHRRPVDLRVRRSETADVSTPLRLVLSLEEHLPATRVRREASSRPLRLVLLLTLPLTFPLPLPWHRSSIAEPHHHSKAITYCSKPARR